MKGAQSITSVLVLVISITTVLGWTGPRHLDILDRAVAQNRPWFPGTVLKADFSESNPCWQDMYDEDCAMETIFSARYVASDWIKNLPCAKGLEDCDFPDDVRVPDIRPESHSEAISVMEFLNIKRANSVDNNKATP